jgi:serine protease
MQRHHTPSRAGITSAWLAALLCLAPAAAPIAYAQTPDTAQRSTANLATDRLIIKYRPGTAGVAATSSAGERATLHRNAQDAASRAGVRLQHLRVGAFDTQVMRVDRALLPAELARLARDIMASDPSVEYAEPDRLLQLQLVPNDTQYGQQWHYFEPTGGLNLPPAWDKSTGSGVVVAVIDTGYRPHPDLVANLLPGYDFISDTAHSNDGDGRDSDARDTGDFMAAGECGRDPFGQPVPPQDYPSSWHGTHVSGTVAATTNNSTGVAGVAFGARVVPVRVLGKCGGFMSDISDGIVWASGGSVSGIPANANPAKVLNLSLGGQGACDTTLRNAIDGARARGTVVVVAAGNSNADATGFTPANCPGVIAVAAVNRSGGRSYFSNYGNVVSVAAPGGDLRSGEANGILSTLNAGTTSPGADNYGYYQGTSMAAPHVAGVAALMLARNPALRPDDLAARLRASTRPFPASCSGCGTGIVNASAAVDAADGTTPPPPPPPPASQEVEPNDSRFAAQAITLGSAMNGTISSLFDTDYFRVTVPANGSLTASLQPNAASDFDLYVYNAFGFLVGTSVNGTGEADNVNLTNGATPGTYYVRVRYASGGTGGTRGAYTLRIN